MAVSLKRVLITDDIDQKCLDILTNNGIEAVKNTKLSKEELQQEIKNFDGLIVRSATKVTEDVIESGSRLKIIGRAGTGVDNIDCKTATKNGVIVMNTPGGNTLSAAEHTCALLMSMSRHIAHGTHTLRDGLWERKRLMGNEVYGKTLGIIGLGRIGKEVALRMQAFGMTTIGYDPIIPGTVSAEFGVEWMPLENLWPKVDYVTVHTPLIPQTKNLINDDVFSKCKKGVRVINCARGGIIDEEALLRALESGQCAGAGLDVFIEEPPKDNPLIKHPLVTSTPHLGANTYEAQSRVAEEIAQQFVDFSEGRSLFGAINAQALSTALSPSTAPWVDVAVSLGKIAAAFGGKLSGQSKITLTSSGIQLKSAGYLKAAALMGLLASQTSQPLNLVNAPAFADDLNIKIGAEYLDNSNDMITVSVSQQDRTFSVSGGTVGANKPFLTSINGLNFMSGFFAQGEVIIYNAPVSSTGRILELLSKENLKSFECTLPSDNSVWACAQCDFSKDLEAAMSTESTECKVIKL